VSNEIQCSNNENVLSKSKYWRKGKYEQKYIIDAHDIVQIKNALQYNYIYCASLNINIYNIKRFLCCPAINHSKLEIFVTNHSK
jgi:hypothetical protein